MAGTSCWIRGREPAAQRPGKARARARTRAPAWTSRQKDDADKDLYREAGEMGEAELSPRWDELRKRQQDLIREYFEQAGLGGADLGRGAG
ncbi:MAG: hypothetical protein ACM3ML_25810 [Micromonosporaceae bacterium]